MDTSESTVGASPNDQGPAGPSRESCQEALRERAGCVRSGKFWPLSGSATNGKAGQGVQGRPGVEPGRVSGDPLYLGQRPPPAPRDVGRMR